jgi:hypothetical protein
LSVASAALRKASNIAIASSVAPATVSPITRNALARA